MPRSEGRSCNESEARLRDAGRGRTPGAAVVVRLVGPRLIAVTPETPLAKKLVIAAASKQQTPAPVLRVTGSVVARLPAGKGPPEDRWQFSNPELLSAYTDWQKARVEVDFAEKQLTKVRALHTARVTAQTKVVE